jgi:hypothetical protein
VQHGGADVEPVIAGTSSGFVPVMLFTTLASKPQIPELQSTATHWRGIKVDGNTRTCDRSGGNAQVIVAPPPFSLSLHSMKSNPPPARYEATF